MVVEITLITRNKKLNKKSYGLAVKEIVVVDRQKLKCRVIEKIGSYDKVNNKLILNVYRIAFWLSKNAVFSKAYKKFIDKFM